MCITWSRHNKLKLFSLLFFSFLSFGAATSNYYAPNQGNQRSIGTVNYPQNSLPKIRHIARSVLKTRKIESAAVGKNLKEVKKALNKTKTSLSKLSPYNEELKHVVKGQREVMEGLSSVESPSLHRDKKEITLSDGKVLTTDTIKESYDNKKATPISTTSNTSQAEPDTTGGQVKTLSKSALLSVDQTRKFFEQRQMRYQDDPLMHKQTARQKQVIDRVFHELEENLKQLESHGRLSNSNNGANMQKQVTLRRSKARPEPLQPTLQTITRHRR